MKFNIRAAEKSDVKEIYRLLRSLAEYQRLTEEFKITPERLCEIIFDEKSVSSLVAECDGNVIGTALYYTTGISTFSGNKILFLEDIYIMEEYRKNGVGREFFSTLRNIAKENDCCKIEWKCQSWNLNAGNFYKGIGSKQEEGWTSFSINHI